MYVTLSTIDSGASEIALFLKGQDDSACNVLVVWYEPSRGTVQVWTCDVTHSWQQQGSDISTTFATGDQFGARAHADGTVDVYRNGTLLGSVTIGTNWDFRASGGAIGVVLQNVGSTLLDDFGGGTLSSAATATTTNTPTATPTGAPTATTTNTPTATPTNTPTATATNTPTATPTNTQRPPLRIRPQRHRPTRQQPPLRIRPQRHRPTRQLLPLRIRPQRHPRQPAHLCQHLRHG